MRHTTDFQPATRRGQSATWGMALGLAIALFVLLFVANQSIGSSLERAALDFWFALRTSDAPAPSRVSILAIDRQTVRRWRGQNFNNADVRRLLVLLHEKRVLAAALAWPEFSDGALLGGTARSRRELQRALAAGSGFCVPLRLEAPPGIVATDNILAEDAALLHENDFFAATARPGVDVVNGAASAGHLSFALDDDGRVRRLPLVLRADGRDYPALALATARLALKHAAIESADSNALQLGGRRLPLLSDGTMLLNFPPRAHNFFSNPRNAPLRSTETTLNGTPFRVISIAAALDNPKLLDALRGGVVVIGPTASSAALYATPTGALLPATALHAIALDNILSGNALERMNPLISWLLTILLCVTVGGLVAARSALWSGGAMLLALSGAALLSFGLFQQNLWLDISPAYLAATLTFFSGVIGRARRQDRESTHHAATISALSQVSEIMATQTDITPDGARLLQLTLQWAVDVMRVDGGAVLLLDDDGRELRFAETIGPRAEELRGLKLKLGEGIAGTVAQKGEAAIVNDVRRDNRFRREYSQGIEVPVRSILCVPLRLRDRMMGVVEVINRADKNPFTSSDAELLGAVANQTALVLENARLYAILNARVTQSESDLESINRRLEAERNTLHTILQSMTDGVLVSDENGRVQLINPAAGALLPELDAAIGRSLSELLPDVASAAALLRESKNVGASTRSDAKRDAATRNADKRDENDGRKKSDVPESRDGENGSRENRDTTRNRDVAAQDGENRDATGNHEDEKAREYSQPDARGALLLQRGDADSPQWIEAHSAPLRGNGGDLIGVVSVLSDVTEARGIEQAKSDFVSFVAHEMRSPLTSISGFSSMLSRQETQKTPLTPAQQEARARFLGIIRNESERLTRLINSLLDVARIEAGRDLELHREAVDFAPLAREVAEMQRAYSSRHKIEVELPDHLPQVFADRDKVAQILINLISNALKYSPGGTVSIHARVLASSSDAAGAGAAKSAGVTSGADVLEIGVRDEGPGIAPEQQDRLFQRFGRIGTRGAAAPNPGPGERAKPTGTGLGLFLTRYLVESHGGTIRVESEPGGGANFLFTLPLFR